MRLWDRREGLVTRDWNFYSTILFKHNGLERQACGWGILAS
ncbi:hypothetical protein JOC55_003636 [Paenibacillus sacheonensis]|nr:hypothetical protein [Paenibacillus sacheonensis]